jgi:lipoate-protein ligase A
MLFEEMTEVSDPEGHDGALNMAIDELLLRESRGPLLRIYRWARPAVSFGYFGNFARVQQAWPGREFVRRWTGGGAVVHGDDLTYTLIVPRPHSFARLTARESYRLIHEHIAGLLSEAGCAASVAGAAPRKISEACFEYPVESDVLAGERKIAGAAQRRTVSGLIHQGSIQAGALRDRIASRMPAALARVRDRRELQPEELAAAASLAAGKYGAEAWLRRY